MADPDMFNQRDVKNSTRQSAANICADEEVSKELSDEYSEEMQRRMGSTLKCDFDSVIIIVESDA